MEYSISWNGKEYQLPKYSLKVAEKIETVETIRCSTSKVEKKTQEVYKFVADLVGKENAFEIVGKLPDLDLNELEIIYSTVIDAYAKPLSDYASEKVSEKIDSQQIDKLLELIQALPQLEKLKK